MFQLNAVPLTKHAHTTLYSYLQDMAESKLAGPIKLRKQ